MEHIDKIKETSIISIEVSSLSQKTNYIVALL